MNKVLFESFGGSEITDVILEDASKLFSENYGIWGKGSGRAGKPVRLSGPRLREKWLPDSAMNFYTKVTVGGQLAGNVFCSRWVASGKTICWVTQLVVNRNYRERGLASSLLASLRRDDDDMYGIISSHPAALLAFTKAFGTNIEKVSIPFIREHADLAMKSSPIPYVRDAKLSRGLLNPDVPHDPHDIISGVNTQFLVDHGEPLEALDLVSIVIKD